jgi:trigger factor
MQHVEIENEGLKRAYQLTFTAAEIDERIAGEVKRLAPQVKMPGFRPGKVPPTSSARCMAEEALHRTRCRPPSTGRAAAPSDQGLRRRCSRRS